MQNRFSQLKNKSLTNENFSRQALALLETELRELALFSLQEWLKLEIVSPDLFSAVANLRFPAWGTWNGLILALRKVRNKTLQQADAEQRKKIEQSPLTVLLNHLFKNIKNDNTKQWLRDFYKSEQIKQSLPRKASLQHLLSVPINLRNRIAHDNPNDPAYWQTLAEVLRPTINWLANQTPLSPSITPETPWFITQNQQLFTFNGISNKGDTLNYVSDLGTPLEDDGYTHEVLSVFKKIMGKTELQENNFHQLLGKLAPDEEKGILMGDFLLGQFIDEGAHGSVHKGIQLSTGRHVAIKLLKDGLPKDIKYRFKQEAEFLSRLNHPHIVDVIAYVPNEPWKPPTAREYSLDNEMWYQDFSANSPKGGIKTFIAMEWITGQTLDDYYLEKKAQKVPVDFLKLTQWFIDITTALEHVHKSDIIHRDIKPSNLMINAQGMIKLMDFGIARRYEELDSRLTKDLLARLGSPAYMSPEQIKANETNDYVGPASDIYGLMAVFYELYTQQRLYNHDSDDVTEDTLTELKTDKKERPTAPVQHNEKIPPEINTILSIGLEHEIKDRYPNMKSLQQDLEHVQKNEPIEQKKPTLWRRVELGYKRNRQVINISGLSLLILIASTLFYFQNIKQQRDRAISAEKATQKEILEKNYGLAKVFEEKALTALKKGDNEQENDREKTIDDYRKAWLYALEAEKMQIPTEKKALKQASLNVISHLSLNALNPEIASTPQKLDIGSDINIVSYSPNGKLLASALDDNTIKLWDTKTGQLKRTFKGHDQPIWAMSYSPDGNTVASGSLDASIKLWNTKTGQLKQTIKLKNNNSIYALSYSPDSRVLASAVADHSIKLWDTKTGKIKQTLLGHEATVWALSHSPDGSVLASASVNGDIKLWDTNTGQLKKNLEGHEKRVSDLSYSPDGSVLASASEDKSIKLWDTKTGQLKQTIIDNKNGMLALSYSPDGKIIASSTQIFSGSLTDSIKLWDAKTGQLKQLLKSEYAIHSLSYNYDGSMLASGSWNNTISLWDMKSNQLKQVFKGHKNSVRAISYNPNGNEFASGSWDKTIKLWDAKTGRVKQTLKGHKDKVTALSYSPDGKLLASASWDKTIKLWNTKTGQLTQTITGHNVSFTLSYSPNGNLLASSSWGTIRLWDVKTGQLKQTIKAHLNAIESLSYSPDSSELASASRDKTIKVWNTKTGKLKQTLTGHKGTVSALSYSPNGNLLASGSHDKTIRFWNAKTGQLKQTFTGHKDNITDVGFSPDGNKLASASGQLIQQWEIKTGQLKQTFKGNEVSISALSYSPDGSVLAVGGGRTIKLWDANIGQFKQAQSLSKYKKGFSSILRYNPSGTVIATASNDNIIRLWDVTTGRLKQALKKQSHPITTLNFSSNGTTLAFGLNDNTVKLWNITTGQLKHILKGHDNKVKALSFSPDGSVLASGSGGNQSKNNTIKLWDTATGKLKHTLVKGLKSINNLSYSPDGRILVSSSVSGNAIKLWDTKTGQLKKILKGHKRDIQTLTFSSDGRFLASSSLDSVIKLWDMATGNLKHTLLGHKAFIKVLSFSPDGKILASGSGQIRSNAHTIKLWNTKTGKLNKTLKGHNDQVKALGYSPNGNLLTSASIDGTIIRWDKHALMAQDIFYKYNPKQVSEVLQFLWEMRWDKETLDFTHKVRPPALYPNKWGYFYSRDMDKFMPLLTMPKKGKTKADQIIQWLKNQCAYRDQAQKEKCKKNSL